MLITLILIRNVSRPFPQWKGVAKSDYMCIAYIEL